MEERRLIQRPVDTLTWDGMRALLKIVDADPEHALKALHG